MSSMIDERESFQDSDGKPIVNGYLYIGVEGQDPKLNPTPIYSDRGLNTALANPQRTDSFGRSVNKIWVAGRYSLKVEDQSNVQKLQDLTRGDAVSAGVSSLTNVQGINAVTAEAVPPITSYTDKAVYIFTVANSNTGAITLDAGGGAKSVYRNFNQALQTGEWPANSVQEVIYNQGQDRFELQTPNSSAVETLVASNTTLINTLTATAAADKVGSIIDYSGTTPPPNTLVCPTAATDISRVTYAGLYAKIGDTWGVGDGATTFGMPWFPADYSAVQANGNVGTQTVGDNLAHTHAIRIGSFVGGSVGVTGNNVGAIQSGSSGGSANLAAGSRTLKCVVYQ